MLFLLRFLPFLYDFCRFGFCECLVPQEAVLHTVDEFYPGQGIKEVVVRHIPREENKGADKLANKAIAEEKKRNL